MEVSDTCKFATVSPDAAGAQMLVGDFVSAMLTMVKFMIIMTASTWSDEMLAAVNSFRCAMTNGFENTWMLLMAAYHFCLTFGLQQLVIDFMNWFYPQVCTCNEDATNISLAIIGQ